MSALRDPAMNAPAPLQSAVLVPGEAGVPQPAPRRAAWPVLVPIVAALVGAIVWFTVHEPAADMVRSLPPAERAKVVERALANLTDACARPQHPREFCREQAELIVTLPECDAACRAVAQRAIAADSATR